jgi:hypothetical protein
LSNVVPLNGGDVVPAMGEVNTTLVSMLEAVLRDAKSGQLQSFIGTGFLADGLRYAAWADQHPNVYEMLGAIAWLHAEYIQRHT